jgi:hypothetical protein
MICRSCGYSLRGLESSVCPECGQPFDAHDVNSFRFGTINGRVSLAVAAAWFVVNAAIWVGVGTYTLPIPRFSVWQAGFIVGALGAFLVLVSTALGAWLICQMRQRRWRLSHRRSVLVGLFLLALAWCFNVWQFVDVL